MSFALFMLVAAAAILTALVVLLHRNPVIGAFFLVSNLVCLAILYLLLDAQFLSAIQVIVYAGAIMVLILFVIMLLNLRHETATVKVGGLQKAAAGLVALGFLALVARAVGTITTPVQTVPASFGTAESVGRVLFRDFFYPFEIISLVILVAMAGAIVLAKKRLD